MRASTPIKWLLIATAALFIGYMAAGFYLLGQLSERKDALRELIASRYGLNMNWRSIEHFKGVLRPTLLLRDVSLRHPDYALDIADMKLRLRPLDTLLHRAPRLHNARIEGCTLKARLPEHQSSRDLPPPPPLRHLHIADCQLQLRDENRQFGGDWQVPVFGADVRFARRGQWSMRGNLHLQSPRHSARTEPLLQRLNTRFRLQMDDARTALKIPDLEIDYERHGLARRLDIKAEMESDGEVRSALIEELAAGEALAFIDRNEYLAAIYSKFINGLQPTARLRNVRLDWPKAGDWKLQAEVNDLRVNPYKGVPGVSSIFGGVRMSADEGRFDFNAKRFYAHFQKILPPHEFSNANGALLWKLKDGQIDIRSEGLQIRTLADVEANTEMRLQLHRRPDQRRWSPEIDLELGAVDIPLPYAIQYVPIPVQRKIPDWLLNSVTDGAVENIKVHIKGPLAKARRKELKLRSDIQMGAVAMHLPLGMKISDLNGKLNMRRGSANGLFNFSGNRLNGIDLGSGGARLKLDAEMLRLAFEGSQLAGNLSRVLGDTQAPLQLHLQSLSLPAIKDLKAAFAGTSDPSSLSVFPPFAVTVDLLRLGEHRLGGLHFESGDDDDALLLENLSWDSVDEDFKLRDGQLRWLHGKSQRTELRGKMHFCNWGEMLKADRCDNQRERNQLGFNLRWPNTPADFDLAEAEGRFDLHLRNGRFAQAKQPGITRAIELFNLDTLFRKGGANFTALSNRGLDFIEGRANGELRDGELLLGEQGFTVKSSSGRYHLSGVVDLRERTMAADLNAILPVAENIGWATLALGSVPQVAIGSWVVSRLLRQELDQLFTSYFKVEGPWKDLKIELVRAQRKAP